MGTRLYNYHECTFHAAKQSNIEMKPNEVYGVVTNNNIETQPNEVYGVNPSDTIVTTPNEVYGIGMSLK